MNNGDEAKASKDLIAYLFDRKKPVDNPELRQHIDFLRDRIPVVEQSHLEAKLGKADKSGGEAEVYIDLPNVAVYKTVFSTVKLGRLGLWGEQGRSIHIKREVGTPLDLFNRVNLMNRHGGFVYTEIAGVTPDGRIILKQPYIADAYSSATNDASRLLAERHLAMVRAEGITSPKAVGVFRKPSPRGEELRLGRLIVDDLTRANVLVDGNGNPYIVDALVRELTPSEQPLVRKSLGIEPGKTQFALKGVTTKADKQLAQRLKGNHGTKEVDRQAPNIVHIAAADFMAKRTGPGSIASKDVIDSVITALHKSGQLENASYTQVQPIVDHVRKIIKIAEGDPDKIDWALEAINHPKVAERAIERFKAKEAPTITEAKALKASMLKYAKGSREGWKAGWKDAAGLIRQQMGKKLKAAKGDAKAKQEARQAIRDQIKTWANDYVPADQRGKLISHVSKARTMNDLRKALNRIVNIRSKVEIKRALKGVGKFDKKTILTEFAPKSHSKVSDLLEQSRRAAAIGKASKDPTERRTIAKQLNDLAAQLEAIRKQDRFERVRDVLVPNEITRQHGPSGHTLQDRPQGIAQAYPRRGEQRKHSLPFLRPWHPHAHDHLPRFGR